MELLRLEEENRRLRAALAASDLGRALLEQSDELSRLLKVSQLIVAELDAGKIFDLVAEHAREMVSAELVLVPMLDDQRTRYTYVAAAGVDADQVKGASFAATVGMCGWVLRHERCLLFGESSTHWMDETTPWEAGQQSAVLVPLVGRNGIIGGLSALGKRGGGPFTRHDLEVLTMFANQVSVAIENALLFQQRREAERALRASEGRFRAIIEQAPVGIIAADAATHQLRYANTVACRMLDYELDELLALDVRALHPEAELARVEVGLAELKGIQTSCRRRDGGEIAVDVKPVVVELDGVPCVVGFFTDLTERHLLEAEQLKTQKLEAIGKLAGGIAHDFNNLLQRVVGYVQMARANHEASNGAHDMLEQAETALEQTVGLTHQLLTFAKGGKPVKKVVDLRPLIEVSTRLMVSGSRSAPRLAIPDELWCAEVDAGQIGQVLQNIVLNADEAMPDGGTISVTASNLARGSGELPAGLAAGDYVRVSIEDEGGGIPAEYLPRIFDPYFSTKARGSGLGLATSYSIVRHHAGDIVVSSQPGRGSRFTVYLPAVVGARPAPAVAAVDGSLACTGLRILVMDDEEPLRKLALAMLRRLGHDGEVAAHGDEAVELYRAARAAGRPFDVVVLDLTIRGGLGGRDTLERLRELDPEVVAVVASGYSDDSSMADHLVHGFKACLKKPYSLSSLRKTLHELSARSSDG